MVGDLPDGGERVWDDNFIYLLYTQPPNHINLSINCNDYAGLDQGTLLSG